MIKKILIANRSEIACRVIRTCKELNIKTVAVYSEADEKSLHVQLADEAVFIGPAPANQSYLNHEKIIEAAKSKNCDAIHPGYGFLSENPVFNQKVRDAGLVFIGPSPQSMSLLGSKVKSRETMIEAGIPVIPGMKGSSSIIADYEKLADEMGFPVLIKASAGGGGKGMRVVREKSKLKESVESAMRESLSAFGSDEVFLEKYIEQPRHVEFQVAADQHGNAIHIFERECSIQRRHQKIIEETPSTVMDPELRKKMGDTAVKVIQAANYDNVGTVEFLVDKDRNFYFLEVNARIQVEHPITEMVSGIDLVKLQISIANGNPLPWTQADLLQRGHSIECRIYAEDSDNNFMPSSGNILYLKEPVGPGVRYDSGITEGSVVPVFYDPILAKLIVHAETRDDAINKMINALKSNPVLGVKTSIDFMIKCLEHPEFQKGNTFTDFIEKHFDDLIKVDKDDLDLALSVAVEHSGIETGSQQHETSALHSNGTPWNKIGKWELWQ